MDKNVFIVILITAPSLEVGKQIARRLIEQNLAACVNIISPALSIYRWEGQIQEDEETLLIVKSRAELFIDHVIPTVKAIHPYQVPEIIALPIQAGLDAYLEWLQKETRLNTK
jgi:periplasmic divalent cation tolerance protein